MDGSRVKGNGSCRETGRSVNYGDVVSRVRGLGCRSDMQHLTERATSLPASHCNLPGVSARFCANCVSNAGLLKHTLTCHVYSEGPHVSPNIELSVLLVYKRGYVSPKSPTAGAEIVQPESKAAGPSAHHKNRPALKSSSSEPKTELCSGDSAHFCVWGGWFKGLVFELTA